jgi:hypothetical protein
VQQAFTVLLVGVLGAACASFVVIGLVRTRRTRLLRKQAFEMGLRFAASDPFDVPRRYAGFTLLSAGHSPQAGNVTYGRKEGRLVRAFDFRYEVGHGTQRRTRYYRVAVVESDRPMPGLLMWHDSDAGAAPLVAGFAEGHVASWRFRGSRDAAEALADLPDRSAGGGVSFESARGGLMIFSSVGGKTADDVDRLERCIAAARALESVSGGTAESADGRRECGEG